MCLLLIGQPRMLRELLGSLLSDDDVEVIGEYADAAGLQRDCGSDAFARRAGGRPVIAVAGERERVLLQRVAPVVLPARETGHRDLALALERMAAATPKATREEG